MKTKKQIDEKGKMIGEQFKKICIEKPKSKIAKDNRSRFINYYQGYIQALEWVCTKKAQDKPTYFLQEGDLPVVKEVCYKNKIRWLDVKKCLWCKKNEINPKYIALCYECYCIINKGKLSESEKEIHNKIMADLDRERAEIKQNRINKAKNLCGKWSDFTSYDKRRWARLMEICWVRPKKPRCSALKEMQEIEEDFKWHFIYLGDVRSAVYFGFQRKEHQEVELNAGTVAIQKKL